MHASTLWRSAGPALQALALSAALLAPPPANAAGKPGPASAVAASPGVPWPASAVVPTKVMAGRLKSKDRPLVIQIGYELLYGEGHVPGALWAGPGEEPKGLAAIRKLVAKIPREREIVLYCGCCPYRECANLLPAYKLMRGMGFKKIKVLELDNDFNVDWKLGGLPVETGTRSAAAHKH